MTALFNWNKLGRAALAAGLVCGSAAAGDKNDYLAVSGPTPLRFQTVAVRYDPAKVLPPLQMSDQPVTNVLEELPRTAKPAPVVSEPEPPADEPQTATLPPQVDYSLPAPEPRSEAPSQLTPQMLLRYFSNGGNKEILVPIGLEFTPPAPVSGSGRSSAVYTSPPTK